MKRTGASYARLNGHVTARQSKSRSSRAKPRHDQDCDFHAVMRSWKKTRPELLPVHRPLCPKCQKRMTTTAVSDRPAAFATTCLHGVVLSEQYYSLSAGAITRATRDQKPTALKARKRTPRPHDGFDSVGSSEEGTLTPPTFEAAHVGARNSP